MFGGVKHKIFKSNTTKPTHISNVYRARKELRKSKTQAEGNVIKYVINLFKLQNEPINDRIIRNMKNLFELEEDYYKPVKVDNFYSNE